MKKKNLKLTLSKETVRALEGQGLIEVAGGASLRECSEATKPCTLCACVG
jgi:hypothetical protein